MLSGLSTSCFTLLHTHTHTHGHNACAPLSLFGFAAQTYCTHKTLALFSSRVVSPHNTQAGASQLSVPPPPLLVSLSFHWNWKMDNTQPSFQHIAGNYSSTNACHAPFATFVFHLKITTEVQRRKRKSFFWFCFFAPGHFENEILSLAINPAVFVCLTYFFFFSLFADGRFSAAISLKHLLLWNFRKMRKHDSQVMHPTGASGGADLFSSAAVSPACVISKK